MKRSTAMLCLIAAMATTGANVPLVKLLLEGMRAETLLVARFALAAVVLAPLAWHESGPSLTSLGGRQWWTVAILGLVGSVLFTWFVLEGVRRTSGASAGIILAALPAVVAGAGLIRGERLSGGEVAMIALAVAGVAMIHVGAAGATAADASSDPLLGNLLIGCAVLCEAAFVIGARRISTEIGPLRLSLAVALVGLAGCLPPAAVALASSHWAGIELGTAALFVWYALTASVLCTVLWYRGVAHVERWAAGLATAVVPVAALVVAVLVLGETIGAAQVAGAALVVAAIGAGTLARR